jgi:hypothetical protein
LRFESDALAYNAQNTANNINDFMRRFYSDVRDIQNGFLS